MCKTRAHPPFTHVPPQGPTTRPGQSHCTGDRRLSAPFSPARMQHIHRDAHSPIGKRLGPAPPTPAPPRAGRVTLRAPPRWRSGHTHGLLGGPLSPFLPAGSPQRGVLPKVQSPPGPSSSRASLRPGTSGAHGAGVCRRSRRRRSPVSQPPLARPELRRVPPRRACALGTPLAGAGPERAAEVTR